MTSWILNIVGMVFVGVVLELVLPNGKTSTFIKSVFAIFVLYVIVIPLPQLFHSSLSLNNNSATITDANFLMNNNLNKLKALEIGMVETLTQKGFENVSVVISANIYAQELEVNKVYVDLVHLVLKNKDKHINTHEEIKNIILTMVSVNGEDIIFYG